ncbi:MAG: M20/M25/M40 family metallo-hydrolase [Gemmatimonadota bacterium]
MRLTIGAVLLLLSTGTAMAQAPLTPDQQLARDLLKQLIEINTTHVHGSTGPAADAMAARLREAGFPDSDVKVLGPSNSKNTNLVVRYRGSGQARPVLFLAHLDVVEALPEDWSVDPFALIEKDGFFYGRGTSDIKDGDAILVAAFIRLKRAGFVPKRDLIVMLTAGEESSADYVGVEWLLANHRDLIDAPFAVNMDAGDPEIRDGRRVARTVQAAEKVVATYQLEVTNPGGHSSQPVRNNAIYHLAAALTRIGAYDFPARTNEITRGFFKALAGQSTGSLATDLRLVSGRIPDSKAVARLSKDAFYNAQLRTTCVATMVDAGHAVNALPQRARATINCRMLPGDSASTIQATLVRLVADSQVAVTLVNHPLPSPPSPLAPEILQPLQQVTTELWPGVPIVPEMETGATDGIFLRNLGVPVYGVSGVFLDVNDNRAHGRDERIGVKEYYDGAEYIYRLIRALAD